MAEFCHMDYRMKGIQLNTGLNIGGDSPIRVNCNIGCNTLSGYNKEKEKLLTLREEGVLPDMMMDLSLAEHEKPLYLTIRDELNLPFGSVLAYHGFDRKNGLCWENTRFSLLRLCQEGVSFITVHFTADADLFRQAKTKRKIPITSRGGGIVLYDTEQNQRKKNIFREHIEEIIDIVLKHDVAISLGTTFRPSTVLDACDSIHVEETIRQLEICRFLQHKGVKTMVENIGHISLDKLAHHAQLLRQFDAPIMPLGPLPTDAAINQDHISNAIGASVAATMGIAHVINCISRYEHSQSLITLDATIEAIHSARLAAHVADVSRKLPNALNEDKSVTNHRAKLHNCFADGTQCTRCSDVCPLKLFSYD